MLRELCQRDIPNNHYVIDFYTINSTRVYNLKEREIKYIQTQKKYRKKKKMRRIIDTYLLFLKTTESNPTAAIRNINSKPGVPVGGGAFVF